MMKARLTYLAISAALAASFLGNLGLLGYSDGAW